MPSRDDRRVLAGLADRFWAKVAKAGPDECWLWLGSVRKPAKRDNGQGGTTLPHGLFWFEGKSRSAHRVSYMLHHGLAGCGPEAFGLLEHACDTARCVNPRHVFESDHSANLASAYARGRRVPAGAAAPANLADLCAYFEANPM